jgi:hypothetical protein
VSQRIAAAIAFVLVIVAGPPDAAAPRPAMRTAWDLFATEALLATPEARGLFAPHADLDGLASLDPRAPLATPEPGSSALLALGLALLARRSAVARATR